METVEPYHLLLVSFFGALWGSFLNVCIYRIPLGESIVFPASRCPHCHKNIAWYDNIPVVGWLMLRGHCRHCQKAISPLYPLIEVVTALLTVHIVLVFGFSWTTLALITLGYAFLVLMVIDLYHYILPNVITLPGILIGLTVAALPQVGPPIATLHDALIGAAIGGGGLWAFAWIFEKITGKVGMGLGDVKLMGMIGAWLGWQALAFTLFFAALLGSIVGLCWIGLMGRDRAKPIPFGPYLVLSAWSYLFIGAQVYEWYFRTTVPGY
ncbi:MAG: prepilin peptidase [Magnetococcales bacterium]|nr:prepilin peptidase [Magnetococcales bacterium]